jgi:hypothetical protein
MVCRDMSGFVETALAIQGAKPMLRNQLDCIARLVSSSGSVASESTV